MATNDSTDNLLKKLKALSARRKEVLSGLLEGRSDSSIQQKLNISPATIRKHVQELCDYFEIKSVPGKRSNRRQALKKLFDDHGIKLEFSDESEIKGSPETPKPTTDESEINGSSETPKPTTYLTGSVPMDSPFYIRRESVDFVCEQYLEKLSAKGVLPELIKIRGSRSLGKTSLLLRLCQFAEDKGHIVAYVNLDNIFLAKGSEDLEHLTREFANIVVQEFKNSTCLNDDEKKSLDKKAKELEGYWDRELTVPVKFTDFLEGIFEAMPEHPKIIFVDNLDAFQSYDVSQSQDLSQYLAGIIRSWKEIKMIGRARLAWANVVVAYSTLRNSISYASPLQNVGIPIELREFNSSQVLQLAKMYGLDWTQDDFNSLTDFLGGHPMLLNWALYKMSRDNINFEILKKQLLQAEDPNNPISVFLLESLSNLEKSDVLDCFKSIIANSQCDDERKQGLLEQAGLIKFKDCKWQVSCDLYSKYFFNKL